MRRYSSFCPKNASVPWPIFLKSNRKQKHKTDTKGINEICWHIPWTMATAPRKRTKTTFEWKEQIQWQDPSKNYSPTSKYRGLRRSSFDMAHKLIGVTISFVLLWPILSSKHQKQESQNILRHFEPRISSMPKTEIRTTQQINPKRPILTAYLESPDTMQSDIKPLPPRQTSAETLKKIEFPEVKECSKLFETIPIDNFPTDDPFLPWIHDVFPVKNGTSVQFVAQNKRRCDTGEGQEAQMKYWEPQIALFQPVHVKRLSSDKDEFRLTSPSSQQEQQHPDDSTVTTWSHETRFICRFHSLQTGEEEVTLSKYPFNYEYISWRKGKRTMFTREGKEMEQFWLSQLLFSCPVPTQFQLLIQNGEHVGKDDDLSQLYVDVIPIRTPARYREFLFTPAHIGDDDDKTTVFDVSREWGSSHVLPKIVDSGRWANIPVCLPPTERTQQESRKLLTACTWTSASYTRRGDAVSVGDTERRLREWIAFHTMVGFDRIVVYDNTQQPGVKASPLHDIVRGYDNVLYHRWPCQTCNNNRPAHKNPGERSSQYAAEASCRERYGPSSEWMAFVDTDEYLVPMDGSGTWENVLKYMDKRKIHILKMRSSRGKPIVKMMEPLNDQSQCKPPKSRHENEPDKCVAPRADKTFLEVYNCDFIKPPKPDRFGRAMKQIYKPNYVMSHFVHYSTVTRDIARLRKDHGPNEIFIADTHSAKWESTMPEVFLNELSEGTLIHSRSVLPHDTMRRTSECYLNSNYTCNLGYPCPDSVPFVDKLHKNNVFQDGNGSYCNCWRNTRVDDFFVPKLEASLTT